MTDDERGGRCGYIEELDAGGRFPCTTQGGGMGAVVRSKLVLLLSLSSLVACHNTTSLFPFLISLCRGWIYQNEQVCCMNRLID